MTKPIMKNYTPGCSLVKLFMDICVKHAKFFMGKTLCRVEPFWSNKRVVFKDNPGKKLRRHANSKPHKDAIESLTHLRIEDTFS